MRTITVIGPEGCGVTVHTVNDAMNERFQEIKLRNPRGFMDEFDQRMEIIGEEIAAEFGGQFTTIDDVDSSGKACLGLIFTTNGVSVRDALRAMGK